MRKEKKGEKSVKSSAEAVVEKGAKSASRSKAVVERVAPEVSEFSVAPNAPIAAVSPVTPTPEIMYWCEPKKGQKRRGRFTGFLVGFLLFIIALIVGFGAGLYIGNSEYNIWFESDKGSSSGENTGDASGSDEEEVAEIPEWNPAERGELTEEDARQITSLYVDNAEISLEVSGIVGRREIYNSPIRGYQFVRVSALSSGSRGGVAVYAYRVFPDGEWRDGFSSNGIVSCDSFNGEMARAFATFSCVTGSVSSVRDVGVSNLAVVGEYWGLWAAENGLR